MGKTTSPSIQVTPHENTPVHGSSLYNDECNDGCLKMSTPSSVIRHSNKEGLITNSVTWQHRRLCRQPRWICPGAQVPWCLVCQHDTWLIAHDVSATRDGEKIVKKSEWARGMVGQLISSCWRADKCAKDWMSKNKTNQTNKQHPDKTRKRHPAT